MSLFNVVLCLKLHLKRDSESLNAPFPYPFRCLTSAAFTVYGSQLAQQKQPRSSPYLSILRLSTCTHNKKQARSDTSIADTAYCRLPQNRSWTSTFLIASLHYLLCGVALEISSVNSGPGSIAQHCNHAECNISADHRFCSPVICQFCHFTDCRFPRCDKFSTFFDRILTRTI